MVEQNDLSLVSQRAVTLAEEENVGLLLLMLWLSIYLGRKEIARLLVKQHIGSTQRSLTSFATVPKRRNEQWSHRTPEAPASDSVRRFLPVAVQNSVAVDSGIISEEPPTARDDPFSGASLEYDVEKSVVMRCSLRFRVVSSPI